LKTEGKRKKQILTTKKPQSFNWISWTK